MTNPRYYVCADCAWIGADGDREVCNYGDEAGTLVHPVPTHALDLSCRLGKCEGCPVWEPCGPLAAVPGIPPYLGDPPVTVGRMEPVGPPPGAGEPVPIGDDIPF